MLKNVVGFDEIWSRLHPRSRGLRALVRWFERKFGVSVVYDVAHIPYGLPELVDVFEIAEKLKRSGVITRYERSESPSDEPHYYQWSAEYLTRGHHYERGGGMSMESERDALLPALAEALERYLWLEETDYLVRPHTIPLADLEKKSNYISPRTFVGFSDVQRAEDKKMSYSPNATFTYARGYSWTHNKKVYVPVQTISASLVNTSSPHCTEPMIHPQITTGLATWSTHMGAVLRGALEVIERDAYMIMWLNQLSLPRLDLESVAQNSDSIQTLLDTCTRYRLAVYSMRLITDAPTYVIASVVVDTTGREPRITVGCKAHRSLASAVEGSILEALRARQSLRFWWLPDPIVGKALTKAPQTVNHSERAVWWCDGVRSKELEFLYAGAVTPPPRESWEDDTEEEHLARIVQWCKNKKYEMVSVSLGTSRKNTTGWSVEMVVIPELQPMHQDERYHAMSGARIADIPTQFGYTPRTEAFNERPHPFA
jgi:ribosomal protein S12 methylthiotransferase accessory factor